jgi:DNA-binding MarR family transcriptional regulator
MTSQMLPSLERKDLIERTVDTADTRARRLRVTRRGTRLAPRAIAVVEQVDAEFFAAFRSRRPCASFGVWCRSAVFWSPDG